MEDKTQKKSPGSPKSPESRSAFNRRPASPSPAATETGGEGQPIPSQPRSFTPVRPQRTSPPRKNLSGTPTPQPTPTATPGDTQPVQSVNDKASKSALSGDSTKKADGAAAETPDKAKGADTPAAAKPDSTSKAATGEAATAAAASTGESAPRSALRKPADAPPQSSGAGGDTIRLRVSPRPQARTLNTAPGRGVRRRLPDIRQGKATKSSAGHYGPFALMFGFLWLIFKMIFFTVLVLGLGALIGFIVMTEYIKTPEVTVPNVSGMKIDEAFDTLSEKNLGVIKRGIESSALVAPGEIISQQPPAGAKAKVDTDVGVIISSGRAQFVVPDVINETRENAINKIRGARLEVGNVLTVEDNNVPRGNVISQSPIGGTGQDEPGKVDLMISAGPPGKSLTMPDLSGRSVLEAKAALKAVGVEDVVTEPSDAPADATVISHDPLVGKTVFQTDRITLVTRED